MQLIFDRDHTPTRFQLLRLIHRLNSEVMHEARQTFCHDLFSMFHKTGSCSTLYFCLVMQITSYEDKVFPACIICILRLILKPRGEISDKKSVHLYTRVNRFIYNILYIIHSSNL